MHNFACQMLDNYAGLCTLFQQLAIACTDRAARVKGVSGGTVSQIIITRAPPRQASPDVVSEVEY